LPRILLVDDDKDHLTTFSIILEAAGYSVHRCVDSAAALLKFKPNYYDLSVIDYRMPGLNGYSLFRLIREIDPNAEILIVTAAYEN
jgi:CheY-like chemotaxis protein